MVHQRDRPNGVDRGMAQNTHLIRVIGLRSVFSTGETYELLRLDRDANKWLNKDHTTQQDLLPACSLFLCRGWPPEALNVFLKDIEPDSGWYGITKVKPVRGNPYLRIRGMYGTSVAELFNGYWKP